MIFSNIIESPHICPGKVDTHSNYYLTDFFANYEDVNLENFSFQKIYQKNNTYFETLFHFTNIKIWIYYTISSIITCFIVFSVEYLSIWLYYQRINQIDSENSFISLLKWLISAILLIIISTGICHILASEAQGAGVPELKCFLSGAKIPELLEFRVFIAKYIGLTLALAAGAVGGRVGPNFHMGAMIFHHISKFSYFKEIRKNTVSKNQSIMIGSAVGFACTFGTPLAGLIAAIEIAGKLSTLRTMWILYVSLLISTICYNFLANIGLVPKLNTLSFLWNRDINEIMSYVFLGCLCGIFGALCIKIFVRFQIYRNLPTSNSILRSRYKYCILMIIFSSLLQFKYEYLRAPVKILFNELFSNDSHSLTYPYPHRSDSFNLFLLMFSKMIMFFFSITSPIPNGIIAPFIIMGSCLGRIFGNLTGYQEIGKFAIVSGAAVASMSTKFFSLTILVLELSDENNLIFPLMITVAFAHGVGSLITKSFFYSNIEIKNLNYFPKVMKERIYKLIARDIMEFPLVFFKIESKIQEILEFLIEGEGICKNDYITIVKQNEKGFILFGIIKIEKIIKLIKNKVHDIENDNDKWIEKLKILLHLYSLIDEDKRVNGKKMIEKTEHIYIKMQHEKNLQTFFSTQKNEEKDTIENLQDYENENGKNKFLNNKIDFMDSELEIEKFPITVKSSINLCKIHYLYMSLGVSCLYVVDDGIFKGVITRKKFFELK